jgi:PAS domain S-box-containing protein
VADFTYDWEYWIGVDGNYRYVSPSCEHITGYGPDEFLKDPGLLKTITHPDDREEIDRHIGEESEREKAISFDFRIITQGGEERWIGHICQPVYSPDGRYLGRRASNRDITERKSAEEALQKGSEKLRFFAYSVMHDLKSPATGIYGLTKLLHKHHKDSLNKKGRNYCDQILKASVHVVALIEKINVYIATKEAPLQIEKINAKEILQIVRDEFSPRLAVRQIEWLEPETIVEIRADRLAFLRVFRNFVDNALKYGGKDLSEIRIEYKDSEQFHVFSVSDDGAGINGANYERIFALFQRDETSRGVVGAGLGLAIVREIAERHRGRVWAEPGQDKGATFHLSVSKDL